MSSGVQALARTKQPHPISKTAEAPWSMREGKYKASLRSTSPGAESGCLSVTSCKELYRLTLLWSLCRTTGVLIVRTAGSSTASCSAASSIFGLEHVFDDGTGLLLSAGLGKVRFRVRFRTGVMYFNQMFSKCSAGFYNSMFLPHRRIVL